FAEEPPRVGDLHLPNDPPPFNPPPFPPPFVIIHPILDPVLPPGDVLDPPLIVVLPFPPSLHTCMTLLVDETTVPLGSRVNVTYVVRGLNAVRFITLDRN